jgi:hypothetical protein
MPGQSSWTRYGVPTPMNASRPRLDSSSSATAMPVAMPGTMARMTGTPCSTIVTPAACRALRPSGRRKATSRARRAAVSVSVVTIASAA